MAEENSNAEISKMIWLVPVVILVLWLATWLLGVYLVDDWAKRGQFGDLFGSINALFSGLALAGVVTAIFLQKQELALQRAELKMTRDELRRTADAQEKSEDAVARQAHALQQAAQLQGLTSLLGVYSGSSSQHKNCWVEIEKILGEAGVKVKD